jgi:hypothetical protein
VQVECPAVRICHFEQLVARPDREVTNLGLDCDTLCVDGCKVCVFEQANKVGFRGFLKCPYGRGLEAEVSFEVLSNFSDKTLERELANLE